MASLPSRPRATGGPLPNSATPDDLTSSSFEPDADANSVEHHVEFRPPPRELPGANPRGHNASHLHTHHSLQLLLSSTEFPREHHGDECQMTFRQTGARSHLWATLASR